MGTQLVGREHGVDRDALRLGGARELERLEPTGGRRHQRRQRVHLDGLARRTGHRAQQRAVALVPAGDEAARDELERAGVELAQHAGERHQLLGRGVVRGHLAAVVRDVDVELRRAEAERSLPHRIPHQVAHRLDLVGARRAHRGVVAHHEAAHRRVADVAAGVHRDAPGEAPPVVAEAPALPAEPDRQRFGRHALDARQHLGQPADVVRAGRREREAAVAGEHRGDAVPRGRRRQGIPGELGIVVRVDVDEAGRHDQPVGVDHAVRRTVDPADAGDPAVTHGDVGSASRPAGAVDHEPAANDQIPRHRALPLVEIRHGEHGLAHALRRSARRASGRLVRVFAGRLATCHSIGGLVRTSRLVAPERDALHHLVVLVDVDAPQQLVVLAEPQAVLRVRELVVVRHELDQVGRVAVDRSPRRSGSRWPRSRSTAGCGPEARGRDRRDRCRRSSRRAASPPAGACDACSASRATARPGRRAASGAGSGCSARRPATVNRRKVRCSPRGSVCSVTSTSRVRTSSSLA